MHYLWTFERLLKLKALLVGGCINAFIQLEIKVPITQARRITRGSFLLPWLRLHYAGIKEEKVGVENNSSSPPFNSRSFSNNACPWTSDKLVNQIVGLWLFFLFASQCSSWGGLVIKTPTSLVSSTKTINSVSISITFLCHEKNSSMN